VPRLFILSGPDTGKSVEVADGATLGRATECSVCLHDRSVSRQHARLERTDATWKVVDTQSRNGVTVRGKRVAEAALADGEEFLIGEVLLRFRSELRTEPEKPRAEIRQPEPKLAELELEEIELESAAEPDLEPTISAAQTAFAPPPTLPTTSRTEPALTGVPVQPAGPTRPGVTVQRGQGVLQYKRIPDREGFLASDLAQQPLWIRIGAGLLALAVFAAILYFAFKGTTILRERASGNGPEVPAEESR